MEVMCRKMDLKYCSILVLLAMMVHFTNTQSVFWHSLDDLDSVAPLPDLESRHNMYDNNGTWCQYRDFQVKYTRDVFRLQSSFWCYRYTGPSRINPEVGYYNVSINMKDGLRYHLILLDGVMHDVDYTNQDSVKLISKSLKAAQDTEKWIQCCKAAESCCSFMLTHPNTLHGCPVTWDAWACRYETKNDSVQYGTCPDYIYSGSPPVCNHESSKRCFGDGTWNVSTDYSTCDITPRIEQRVVFHVVILSVSLVFSIPAVVIFFSYRKLRKTMRVILHRNLLIAIVIRNILAIISRSVIILDAISSTNEGDSVMDKNGVGCKILAVLEKLATNAVFACMLLLGVYLHRLIAAAFRGEPNMLYYFIGASVTCSLPVLVWTIVTAILNNKYCWTVDDGGFQWINDSFKIAMLAINMLLIIDIIRVLVTKLSQVNTGNSKNIRRTTKATIFLLPVFGVQFIFTAARPNTTNCTGEQVFYFFSYFLDGIQGAVVSLLFCYLNKEVQSLVSKTFTVTKDKVHMRFDKDYVPRSSTNANDPRRITFSTMVEPNNKDLSAPPTPVLNARTPEQWNVKGKLEDEEKSDKFYSPKNSISESFKMSDLELNFHTPKNSVAGSPVSDDNFFYSPRSSFTGSLVDVNFYDCIDDSTEVFDLSDKEYSRKLTAETNHNIRQRKMSVFNDDVSKISSNGDLKSTSPICNSNILPQNGTSFKVRGSPSDNKRVSLKNTNDYLDDSGYEASPDGSRSCSVDNRAFSISSENLSGVPSTSKKRIATFDNELNDTEV